MLTSSLLSLEFFAYFFFRNPMGRTGIRGKGSLWRWGPNHVMRSVVTRWRRKYTGDFQPMNYLYVDGKKVLEFVAVRKENADEYLFCLPGVSLKM